MKAKPVSASANEKRLASHLTLLTAIDGYGDACYEAGKAVWDRERGAEMHWRREKANLKGQIKELIEKVMT